MQNLKTSSKLIVSFMIVIALAIAVGVIGIVGMHSINNADDAMYSNNVLAMGAMGNIRVVLQDQRTQLRNMCLNAGDSAKIQEYQNTLTALENEMEQLFAEYEITIVDKSLEHAYFDAKDIYHNEFSDAKKKICNASLDGSDAAYNALYAPSNTDITFAMVKGFNDSMEHNAQWAEETVDNNTALYKTMLIIEIIVLALAVFIALFFAFYISSLISKPLVKLSAFMSRAGATGDITLSTEDAGTLGKYSQNKDEIGLTINGAVSFINHVTTISEELEVIASGNLTAAIDVLSEADIMGKSMRQMVNNLNSMFSEIQASTDQVSTGSKQVANGALSLAQGATEQAASIEELSSSIAEISERTKTNAITADKTSKLSETIKISAEKGSRQMNEMITAVKEINNASQSISKIIKTIDDIAFQTNILALNAAVEAARAGQHGKGFAVVAEEVRNLASKSAEAAKDTGNMIQNSMDKAQLGSRIAGETAESLKEIVSGINESSQLVNEIAKSSIEQSHGIDQINIGIDQVARVIQQNTATAQESAAASEEMSGQSDMLQHLITQFRIKEPITTNHHISSPEKGVRKSIAIKAERVLSSPSDKASGTFGKY